MSIFHEGSMGRSKRAWAWQKEHSGASARWINLEHFPTPALVLTHSLPICTCSLVTSQDKIRRELWS